jgi:hypothetical protein
MEEIDFIYIQHIMRVGYCDKFRGFLVELVEN